ncbi:MAG: hypothetical protein ACYYK0_01100 [Candidatus Eutrophobiaceae bacterium]
MCLGDLSAACSAAVVVEDVNYDPYELAERRHVSALLPMAEDLMKQAGIKGHDLDAIAFGRR